MNTNTHRKGNWFLVLSILGAALGAAAFAEEEKPRGDRHEGKITGLAAYGEPEYVDILRRILIYKDGKIINVGNVFFHSALKALRKMLPRNFSKANLATSVLVPVNSFCWPFSMGPSAARSVSAVGYPGATPNLRTDAQVWR